MTNQPEWRQTEQEHLLARLQAVRERLEEVAEELEVEADADLDWADAYAERFVYGKGE